MKGLAQASVLLAIIIFVAGILMKLGMPAIMGLGLGGTTKVTSILLLFGINFALLELLKK
ncbi:MAG: hypothetical protein A2Z72_07380 [Omnitrophica bacterium RBG_13_46_9]|nr:MAG: hypothetical protein A2Z72_07380 [Omnitrophica bacterium RBG_13_46_9]